MGLKVLYYSQGRKEDVNALSYLNSMLSESLEALTILYVTEEISAVEEKTRRNLAREQSKHTTNVKREQTFDNADTEYDNTAVELINVSAKGDPVEEVAKKLK